MEIMNSMNQTLAMFLVIGVVFEVGGRGLAKVVFGLRCVLAWILGGA